MQAHSLALRHRPQAVAATAQVLLQRFFCKRSFAQFNVKARSGSAAQRLHSHAHRSPVQRLAAALVFLAAKLEEEQRRARDVINVFYRLERRKEGLALDFLDMFGKARAWPCPPALPSRAAQGD